jgi:predicted AlkP superfamily pyrophosphatase or phosphodiesterase
VAATEHGITSNLTVRKSLLPSIFSVAREHGKTTAAAAYSWYSELYVKAPFDPVLDRELDDDSQLIQHGRFYFEDSFPDAELFAQAGLLITRHLPDYVLIHPMAADFVGHCHGGESSEYRNTVLKQDQILAYAAPMWLAAGYTVLVTGDHGMNADRQHNGTLPDVRHVPLYILPAEGAGSGNTGRVVSQLAVAPTVCWLLGVPPAPTMTHPPLDTLLTR